MTNNCNRRFSYAAVTRRLRPISAVTALIFSWTFVCLPMAQAAQSLQPKPPVAKIKLPPLKLYPAPKVVRNLPKPGPALPLFPYREHEAERERAALASHIQTPPAPKLHSSLLAGVELFNCSPSLLTPKAWKAEMSASGTKPERLAQLHIWYGEWELAQNEQPEKARWYYKTAIRLTSLHDSLHGLATYDDAMATFYEGAYREATRSFAVLTNSKTALSGYSMANSAGWLRHAVACAGYHSQRSAAGIPEPIRLDPYCGAAGLATALRGMGKPYDKATIARACRITGEGSTLEDLINAGPKLGLSVHAIGADDQGLMQLPKPLIAHVEFDHFITVTKVDKHGVTYLCSDCGPWPGGQVDLTWKQWHMLNPGVYGALTTPGSAWDKTLAAAEQTVAPVAVASVASSRPLTGLEDRDFSFVSAHLPLLHGHIYKTKTPGSVSCVGRPTNPGCTSFVQCPQPCSSPGPGSPGLGDPVNLATGDEEYTPPTDMTVYNPVGPSVIWGRVYNSLRNAGNGYAFGNPFYECNDYGVGWSQTYNVSVYDPTGGGTGTKDLVQPNGGIVTFSAASIPTSGSPVQCTVQPGAPYLVEWDYSPTSSTGTYKLTLPGRIKMIFGPAATGTNSYLLSQIMDHNGNILTFNYSAAPGGGFTLPLLSTITNSVGTALLTILRTPDGTGNIWCINDCYGRSIYYSVDDYSESSPCRLLDHVSQIVPSCTQNPADRYVYGYTTVPGIAIEGSFNLLHSITVPSPTGTGSAAALINYDPTTDEVSSTVDANGNYSKYFSSDASGNPLANSAYTTVEFCDAGNNVLYKSTVSFDSNMSGTSATNGAGVVTSTSTYSDPNDPLKPSLITDAYGHTSSYSYDSYGNDLTETDERGVITTKTYSYTNYAPGELMSEQEGTKQATTYTYFEPSGNLHMENSPMPGTVGGTTYVTTTYNYDPLGSPTSTVQPGNGTVSSRTTTFGYTTDGTYTQAEMLGKPITSTDNLGHVTHLRYDAQGNITSSTDALGNETDCTYDIANSALTIVYPATNESGTGHGYAQNNYIYPTGPSVTSTTYDESGNVASRINVAYGLNGETLSVSGSTEPVSYGYDSVYRLTTQTDGNGHTTTTTYNNIGAVATVSYPNSNSLTGFDIVSYPSYDTLGNPLKRVDGRGIETNYSYSDPEYLLTSTNYPGSSALNVTYTYDNYGRKATMTDATGSVTYTYDDDDLPTSTQTTYTGLPAKTISKDYNADGSIASMTTPAGTYGYAYDANSQLTSLTNPYSETTSWGYLSNHWLSTQTLANGVVTTIAYDARGLTTDLSNKSASSTILSDFGSMNHNGVGDCLTITASIPAQTSYAGTTTYGYDAAIAGGTRSQLTNETSTRIGGYTNTNVYDTAGNPTTFRSLLAASYNSDNQLGASGYVFDGSGNPTSYRGNTLTFDAENRMASYGTVMTVGYTGDELRAWKTTSLGTTYYLYDGTQAVCELDSSGTVTASNTLGADGLISRRVGSTSTFYTFDAQGSCVQRFNSSAAVLDTNICDAFGNRVSTDNSTDPYSGFGAKFGYYADSETGLELLTHRYYDPQLGRFINRDPSGSNGGLDLYAYTGNSPIDESDPDGLLPSYDDSGNPPCADQTDMKTAISEACAKIMDIHRVDNSSNPICPTGKEKYCLRRLCAASFTITCDDAYCAAHPAAAAHAVQYSGMTDPNNCKITMCTKTMARSGAVYGAYGADAYANLIVHEMFHCCGRGDNGGPTVPLINPGPNDKDGVGVSNRADDGARCVMGLDGPYLKGYDDGN